MMEILKGHISPETAFVVDDYPYGFRLRCKIRYWLEYSKRHGFRLMSQTTNPKRPGTVWNKPKASTYAKFGGCMFLDENGHVQWSGLSEYSDGAEAEAWAAKYGEGVPESGLPTMRKWLAAKVAYDGARKPGDPLAVGLKEAHLAVAFSVAGRVPCPTCKGAGKVTVTSTTIEPDKPATVEETVIDCVWCNGVGSVTPERAAMVKTINTAWCHCGEVGDSIRYYGDGEHAECTKHHWRHEPGCGKITQVG